MKLTESDLRQIIRQELKKVMGLNETKAEIAGIAEIDAQTLINLLATAGQDWPAKDLNGRLGKKKMYVKNSELQKGTPATLFYEDEDGVEHTYEGKKFSYEFLKRAHEKWIEKAGMSQDRPNR